MSNKFWIIKNNLLATIKVAEDGALTNFLEGDIRWDKLRPGSYQKYLEVFPVEDGAICEIGHFPIAQEITSPDDYWDTKFDDCLPVTAIVVEPPGMKVLSSAGIGDKELLLDIPRQYWYKSSEKTPLTIEGYQSYREYIDGLRNQNRLREEEDKANHFKRSREFQEMFASFPFNEQEKRWMRKYLEAPFKSKDFHHMVNCRFPSKLVRAFLFKNSWEGEVFAKMVKDVLEKD